LLWYDHRHRTELLNTPVEVDLPRIRRLIALGFPAAMQATLESGVFAAVTTVSLSYMVPLGISSAAAVRVGQALGRKDPAGAGDAGGTAIFLGAAFMACAGVGLLVFPRGIARLFTPD